MIVVRPEAPADATGIRAVNELAFPTHAEARLVDALRTNGGLTLSLVAVDEGAIVGHVAFSPVTIDGGGNAVGLAPMAVTPEHQRRGIGGLLIARGLELLSGRFACCVVLGHKAYYPRHGFVPASAHGLRWEHGHADAFFVRALSPDGLSGLRGVVRYRPEFDSL